MTWLLAGLPGHPPHHRARPEPKKTLPPPLEQLQQTAAAHKNSAKGLDYNSSRRPGLPPPAGRREEDLFLLPAFPFLGPVPFRFVALPPPLRSPLELAPSPHLSSASSRPAMGSLPAPFLPEPVPPPPPPPPRDRREGRRRAVNLPDLTLRFHIILPITS